MKILEGKVAVVTGAGRGIGRSESMRLAAEGASVVVNDTGGAPDGSSTNERPADAVVDEIEAAGGRAVANHADVSSWDGGRGLIEQAVDAFGRLDIVICNAGIFRDRMLVNLSEDEWDSVIRVHVKGTLVPTRFAAQHWRQETKANGTPAGGRLIYTSSPVGLYGNEGQMNYGAAKAAIASMALTAARELDPYGVTVNTIIPGGMTRFAVATFPTFATKPEDGSFWEMDPDNVGPWVTYLCSDEAADISGQTFVVVGGRVELFESWKLVSKIKKSSQWTIDELREARRQLFDGRSSGPPLTAFQHHEDEEGLPTEEQRLAARRSG